MRFHQWRCAAEPAPVLYKPFSISFGTATFPSMRWNAQVQPIPINDDNKLTANHIDQEQLTYSSSSILIILWLLIRGSMVWYGMVWFPIPTLPWRINAFDQEWHKVVLNKPPANGLSANGLSAKICLWIANFLKECCTYVVYDNASLTPFCCILTVNYLSDRTQFAALQNI